MFRNDSISLPHPHPLSLVHSLYSAGYDYRGYPAGADYTRPDPYYGYPAGYDRNTAAAAAAAYPYANSYARSYDMAAYSETLSPLSSLFFSFLFPSAVGYFHKIQILLKQSLRPAKAFPSKLVIFQANALYLCPGMYGAAQAGMGVASYGQTPSNYGPARGYTAAPMGGGVADYTKERGGAASRQTGYHPYRRN
jgi:hypothetical protein